MDTFLRAGAEGSCTGRAVLGIMYTEEKVLLL
jgi:hypothetical protein